MTDKPRSAIALRHVAFEDLGLLSGVLAAAGFAVSCRDAALDDLTDPALLDADLLIVLGGPIGVYEVDAYPFLAKEMDLLQRRLALGRAVLGICLGCQLMAKALGARVFAGPVKEIGWGKLDLTGPGRASCLAPLDDDGARVLHWHGDTFDLPEGAVRLASNEIYENQAFAFGKSALALQFHLEADPLRLPQWYVGHAVELTAAGVSVPHLRAATAAVADRVRQQAGKIFGRWLQEII